MATYNRAHLIPETLRAIADQSHTGFECLIIDDGSTDTTQDVINNLKLGERFMYLKRPPKYAKGPSGCRNFGLDLCSGNYIIFFDDDDIPHPENLEICLNAITSGKYDYCRYLRAAFRGDFHYDFDQKKDFDSFEIQGKKGVLDLLSQRLPFNCCAVLWKSHCFDQVRFHKELMYADDRECYQRILVNGAVGISIDKTLFYARKHDASSTGKSSDKNSKEYKSIIKALKLVICNIADHHWLDKRFAKFFAWEAARLGSNSIYKCLVSQKNLSLKNRFLAFFTYYGSPVIKAKIKIQKKFT